MNNSESWKWKNIKERSVHPKSVCIFCNFCVKDKDSDNWEHVYDHNLLCEKHPAIRTIHPVTGQIIYAYWKKNQEIAISQSGSEVCEEEPTIEFIEERYLYCGQFNMDGKCENFEKIGKKEEKERLLSIGEKESIRGMLPFK